MEPIASTRERIKFHPNSGFNAHVLLLQFAGFVCDIPHAVGWQKFGPGETRDQLVTFMPLASLWPSH